MSMLNLNFSGVGNRDPLPEGTYVFTIKKVTEKDSQSSGNPMLEIIFLEEETNTSVFENFTFGENTLWKLKELLACFGYDVSGDLSFEPSELEGLQVKAKAVMSEYKGEQRNRLKKFQPC